MSYKVSLPLFEGPFDLLVYLIENARMSIYDIQVSEITEQYLAYIRGMEEMDLNVAAEFMVLAATLIDIKSRMILPRSTEEDVLGEDVDPRSELVERLLEYKRFKELAEVLGERQEQNALLFEKPQEDISEYLDHPDEVLSLSLDKFVEAFKLFLQREKRVADVKSHYQRIEREKATMEGRISFIRQKIRSIFKRGIGRISMKELVPNKKDRYDVIVTFASILQMMKDRILDAKQSGLYGEIFVVPPAEIKPEEEASHAE